MRIIAGTLSGRVFDSPRGRRTHPMSDKVRGGLFNVLGDISGLQVLDAFAGSGAIGFEAISRGARSVTAIDNDKSAQRAIKASAAALGVTRSHKLVSASLGGWLSTTAQDLDFDLVICDPPYDDTQPQLIDRIGRRTARGGTFVLSWPGNFEPPTLQELDLVSRKSYGDAQLLFYKRP